MAWDVFVLVGKRDALDRLERAHRSAHAAGMLGSFHVLDSWSGLAGELSISPLAIAVVDPFFGVRESITWEMKRIVQHAAGSEVIIYTDFRGRPLAWLTDPALIGVVRIVVAGVDDDVSSLRGHMVAAAGAKKLTEALSDVLSLLSPHQQMILRWAMRRGPERLTLSKLATEIGVSDRTLRRWCDDLSGLTAHDLVRWVRVLHAGRILSASTASLAQISDRMGFSSPSDLRRSIFSLGGVRVSALPRGEIFDRLLVEFRRAIRQAV